VQRVPVRIELDHSQLQQHPLRVGLSMEAEVNVSKTDGKTLADAPRASAVASTQVYTQEDNGADAEVRRIIAANVSSSGIMTGKGTGTSAVGAGAARRPQSKAAAMQSASR
jgi:membrane fusion protein (multidrug efflux system)